MLAEAALVFAYRFGGYASTPFTWTTRSPRQLCRALRCLVSASAGCTAVMDDDAFLDEACERETTSRRVAANLTANFGRRNRPVSVNH